MVMAEIDGGQLERLGRSQILKGGSGAIAVASMSRSGGIMVSIPLGPLSNAGVLP